MTQKNGARSRILEEACVFLLLAFMLLFTFRTVCSPALSPSGYDFFHYFLPNAYFLDYSIHQGEFPLWNPLTLCGTPFAANPQSCLFYPPNLIRAILNTHPTPESSHASLFVLLGLHLLFAGMGVYNLARSHDLRHCSSISAALVFVFSSTVIYDAASFYFICSIAWIPWILWCVRRAMQAADRLKGIKWGIVAGILHGLSALAGSPQMTIYMSVLIAAYALIPHPSPMKSLPARTLRKGVLLLVLFTVSAGVATPMLLPASEFAGFTFRGADTPLDVHAEGLEPAITTAYLYKSLITYGGLDLGIDRVRGFGVIVYLLLLTAAMSGQWRRLLPMAFLLAVTLDCAFGPPWPIASLIEKLAPFDLLVPTRAFVLAGLPVAMLAAVGAEALSIHRPRTGKFKALQSLLLVCTGITLLYFVHKEAILQPHPFLPGLSKGILYVPAVGLILMVLSRWIHRPRVAAILIMALVFSETAVWNARFVPIQFDTQVNVFEESVFPGLSRAMFGADGSRPRRDATFAPGNRRGVQGTPNRNLTNLRPSINGYDPLYIGEVWKAVSNPELDNLYKRRMEWTDCTTRTPRGHSLFKRFFWLSPAWAPGPLPDKETPFAPTQVAFLQDSPEGIPCIDVGSISQRTVSDNTAELGMSFTSVTLENGTGRIRLPDVTLTPKHSVLSLQYACPVPSTVNVLFRDASTGQMEYGLSAALPADPDTQELEIPTPDYSVLQTSLMIKQPGEKGRFTLTGARILVDNADENELIAIREHRMNSVELEVGPLPGPRILSFLDADYPGWKAYVDDKPVKIHRAANAFKAVALTPGTHHVRFEFRPWKVYAGLAIGIITLVGCVVLLTRKSAIP
jgi:hypothetical protein